MTHDWSHLDEAVAIGITKDGHNVNDLARKIAKDAVKSCLSALTPSDIAALIAEKCQGWVAVNVHCVTSEMENASTAYDLGEEWPEIISASPKLGE